MEHGHGVFDGGLGGDTLYRLHDDALRLLVGGELRFIHDVVDIACRSGFCLVFERLHEFVFSFFSR